MVWILSLAVMLSATPADALQHRSLGPAMDVFEDSEGEYSLEQVLALEADAWEKANAETPSFGYTDSVYWARVTLPQRPPGEGRYLLELDYAVLDRVDAWLMHNGTVVGKYRLGDGLPYHERPVDLPQLVFPAHLSAEGETELVMRVATSSSMQLPLHLWEATALGEHSFENALINALFYGAMGVMVLYNLLLFLLLRERAYLYYVAYVLSMLLLVAGIQGVTFKVLWPGTGAWNDTVLLLALSGMVVFPCLFTRTFLHVADDRPLLGRLLAAMALVATLLAVAAFFLPYRPLMQFGVLLSMLSIALNFSTGIVRWFDGFYAARYYNLAWSFMLGGGLVMGLNKLGVVPRNVFTENAGQLGASLEVVLLAYALANRMNHERRMREEAQRQSTEAQQELLESQVEMNRQLDLKVRQRTEELEAANARLHEISTTDALTGLRNRRFFDENLTTEFQRACREKYGICVLMIDIDRFKQINDHWGHAVGDECLCAVAAAIYASLKRPSDLAARYGGEEFVAMLPNTDLAGGVRVAEAIRESVVNLEVPSLPGEFPLSVSVGVAATLPESGSGWDEVVVAADECLYRAKNDGRNQVVAYT